VVVHLVDFFVQGFERWIRGRAFAQQGDAGYDIVIVDDLAVIMLDGAMGAVGARDTRSGELAESDLGALGNYRYIFHADGSAILGENDGLLDVVNVIHLSDFADIDLLQALLDETAAGIGVVVGELLLDLG
jgi:hypothetical protein